MLNIITPRAMQIKAKMIYNYTLLKRLNLKTETTPGVVRTGNRNSYTVCGSVKWYSHLGKRTVSSKAKHVYPKDLAILFLSLYPSEMSI